jgi:hypothetical protein
MGLETGGLSLPGEEHWIPKNSRGERRTPYQIVEKWREENPGKNSAFTTVMRNPIKLLVGITYKAVKKNCWVRNPINI